MKLYDVKNLFELMNQSLVCTQDVKYEYLDLKNYECIVWFRDELLLSVKFNLCSDGNYKFNCDVKLENSIYPILEYSDVKSIEVAKIVFEKCYFYCEDY